MLPVQFVATRGALDVWRDVAAHVEALHLGEEFQMKRPLWLRKVATMQDLVTWQIESKSFIYRLLFVGNKKLRYGSIRWN